MKLSERWLKMKEFNLILKSYEMYIFGVYLIIAQNDYNTYYKISNTSKINDKAFLESVLVGGYKFENLMRELVKANNIFFKTKL